MRDPTPLRPFSPRLLAAALGVVVMLLAVPVVTFEATGVILATDDAAIRENVASLRASAEFQVALLDQKGLAASAVMAPTANWIDVFERRRAPVQAALAALRAAACSPPEVDLVGRIEQTFADYDALRTRAVRLALEGRTDDARALLLDSVWDRAERLGAHCDEMIALNERLLAAASARTANTVRRLRWAVAVVVAGVIASAGVAAWRLHGAVTRRLVAAGRLAGMGRMAGFLAHEIRNPLAAMRARLHTMKSEPLTASAREDVDALAAATSRMESVVGTFLGFQRGADLRATPADLRAVLTHAIRDAGMGAPSPDGRVTLDFPADFPQVPMDGERMRHVFVNLLRNAREAAGDDGGAIAVHAKRLRGPHGAPWVEVSVEDSGPGFARTVTDAAFDPLVTTKPQGFGLGLPLSLWIVRLHGGDLALGKSRLGGAAVRVRLPAGRVGL